MSLPLLEEKVERLGRDLEDARQQQAATADVLKVISRSTFDLQAVLDTLVQSAARLCEADMAAIARQRDGNYHLVARHGFPEGFSEYIETVPMEPGRGSLVGRVLLDCKPVHIVDVLADPEFTMREGQKRGGFRTMLGVPLLREGVPIGALAVNRATVRPFTDKQIELVTTFADQAVIAIENVRLFDEVQARTRELSEALEQQTATSEVLKVISSSPGELCRCSTPCWRTPCAYVRQSSGSCSVSMTKRPFRVAMLNLPPVFDEYLRQRERRKPTPGSDLDILCKSRQVIHTIDMLEKWSTAAPARLGGSRTQLAVPMLKEDRLVGAIAIYRQEVRPFTDKQIELVKNFAAQAVIAIENTRLLNELRESLQQQTATADVLKVISSSPGELQPVFNAMLENATRICEAQFGTLTIVEGDDLHVAAMHGVPRAYEELRRRDPRVPSAVRRRIGTNQVVHIADLAADERYANSPLVAHAGARSYVGVPMLKDGEVIGNLSIYRQEVRPFTAKQIELVANFAAQAVIAIENTRLLNELRQRTDDLSEALDQQTATSEVLSAISSSPGELEPVFNSMLENAVRICEASFGNLLLYDGSVFRHVALHNAPQAWAAEQQRDPVPPRNAARVLYRVVDTKQVTHIADMAAENPDEPIATIAGARTVLIVPMLKENVLIGVIAIYRQEVRPFGDKQIDLVKNFAAQAVIAIENTRLLNELRESLQQQTATSEVLQVISSSPGELDPVFHAMLENAVRICEAKFGMLWLCEGDGFRPVALHGLPPALADQRQRGMVVRPDPEIPLGRLARTKQLLHIADIRTEQGYIKGLQPLVGLADLGGARTLLTVPMLRESDLVGAIAVYRQEVRPFTDKQIELLKSFASQAVIAIENTRLLNELRESLQQQTATADVLKVISRSTFDLRRCSTRWSSRRHGCAKPTWQASFARRARYFEFAANYRMPQAFSRIS